MLSPLPFSRASVDGPRRSSVGGWETHYRSPRSVPGVPWSSFLYDYSRLLQLQLTLSYCDVEDSGDLGEFTERQLSHLFNPAANGPPRLPFRITGVPISPIGRLVRKRPPCPDSPR